LVLDHHCADGVLVYQLLRQFFHLEHVLNPDFIYGSFAIGAFLITMWSVRKAWNTKKAGGISVWFPLYFGCWGFGNLFVFDLFISPVSFIANLLSVGANLFYVWVILCNEKLEKVSEQKR
jgi:hypothetical protein